LKRRIAHGILGALKSEGCVIDDVAGKLEAMKPEQYVLAFVFLGSYAFALGEFIGARGRRIAIATALGAAAAFAGLTDPWELGVMVVAFALVGMGLFAGAVWLLWLLASRMPVEPRAPARPAVKAAATAPAAAAASHPDVNASSAATASP
jgi:hypothetical protein